MYLVHIHDTARHRLRRVLATRFCWTHNRNGLHPALLLVHDIHDGHCHAQPTAWDENADLDQHGLANGKRRVAVLLFVYLHYSTPRKLYWPLSFNRTVWLE